VPVARATGDFKNERAAADILFPDGALTETSKGLDKESEHFRKIRLVANGEG